MANKVRTRFAPSPTGYVHIGSVQKIIYSYACAQAYGGDYILRIEDTDRNRYVEGAEEAIYEGHKMLGIKVDESPEHEGQYGPYRQSERLDLYQKYARELIEAGKAYYAFETAEELAKMREEQQAQGLRPRYNGKSRDLTLEEADERIAAGEKYVVRIRVPEGQELKFHDGIMGEIKMNTNDLDDYVLLKSDGFPTYHLAVVVDDHLMEISHVFRGVEWLPTYPIHLLLYRYLGWEAPHFFHVPNILDPKGGKLSKRSGSVALLDFFREGYLAEAINNFMMLLAWSPKSDRELFTLPEFIKIFNLENFNKSNPVFNRDKLNWFNQQYIRKLTSEQLYERLMEWMQEFKIADSSLTNLSREKLKQALVLEQERVTTLSELHSKLLMFSELPSEYEFDHKFLKKLDNQTKINILEGYKSILQNKLDIAQDVGKDLQNVSAIISHEEWEAEVRAIVDKFDLKAREVFMTIRVALTGKAQSPPLYEFGEVVGIEGQLERIENAINTLN